MDHGCVTLQIAVIRVGCVVVALSPQTCIATVLILQNALGVIVQNHLNQNDFPEKIIERGVFKYDSSYKCVK